MDYEPDDSQVFLTFQDVVHAAILAASGAAGTGAASLKQIYVACIRFGRVRCRKTGGWRLVTAKRNWKSHIRHTLYTTDKFVRSSSDADCWMLAPAYRGTFPQSTRQFVGLPCTGPTDPTHVPQVNDRGCEPSCSRRGTEAAPSHAAAARPRASARRCRRSAAAELEDADPDSSRDDELSGSAAAEDNDSFTAPSGARATRAEAGRRPARAYAAAAAAACHRRGCESALLAVAAEAQAAEEGHAQVEAEEMDGLAAAGADHKALMAAQEVLSNPAAARILLQLMQQREECEWLLQQEQQPTYKRFPVEQARAQQGHAALASEASWETEPGYCMSADTGHEGDEGDEAEEQNRLLLSDPRHAAALLVPLLQRARYGGRSLVGEAQYNRYYASAGGSSGPAMRQPASPPQPPACEQYAAPPPQRSRGVQSRGGRGKRAAEDELHTHTMHEDAAASDGEYAMPPLARRRVTASLQEAAWQLQGAWQGQGGAAGLHPLQCLAVVAGSAAHAATRVR